MVKGIVAELQKKVVFFAYKKLHFEGYLEAVPKAVIKTGLNLATTLKGSVFVQTKYITVSVPKPWITRPRSTVPK